MSLLAQTKAFEKLCATFFSSDVPHATTVHDIRELVQTVTDGGKPVEAERLVQLFVRHATARKYASVNGHLDELAAQGSLQVSNVLGCIASPQEVINPLSSSAEAHEPPRLIGSPIAAVREAKKEKKAARRLRPTEDPESEEAVQGHCEVWEEITDRYVLASLSHSFSSLMFPDVSFEKMNLKRELLRGIHEYGWDLPSPFRISVLKRALCSLATPSPIQQRFIVPLLQGRDALVRTQTGVEKTLPAAIAISILQRIDTSVAKTQALILAPTRELALLVCKAAVALGDHMNLQCYACVGGTNVREEMVRLRSGPHIVVGTPGRVFDMINRHALQTKQLAIACLYEADELLSRGFVDTAKQIVQSFPAETQTVLLCASIVPEVLAMTRKLSHNPVCILMKEAVLTFDSVRQLYVNVAKDKDKINKIFDFYNIMASKQAIVFCGARRAAEFIAQKLQADHRPATVIVSTHACI
jgi:hypothetical protein